MTQRRKPYLNHLPGSYVLDYTIRIDTNIKDNILTGKARDWSSVKCLVNDYFKNESTSHESTYQRFIQQTLNAMKALSENKSIKAELSNYARDVYNYLQSEKLNSMAEANYRRAEVDARVSFESNIAVKEGEVAGAILAANGAKEIADKGKKREVCTL